MSIQMNEVTVAEAARRQVLLREVNERIAELTDSVGWLDYKMLICECSRADCAEPVEITAAEYEAVRAVGSRFVVLAGHQQDDVERVVDRNGRFLIVEKLGRAGEIARGANPRRA